jgi:hypothetical protein
MHGTSWRQSSVLAVGLGVAPAARWGKEKRAVTGVAVQTGTGLLYCLLPFAIGLVVKHAGMATVLTKVAGQGIPGPPRFQAGLFCKPRLRDHRARIGL